MTVGFLLLAVCLNSAAAVASAWRRAVTADGAVVGAITGTAILIVGGFFYWTMLMLFFVTASLVSRAGKKRKAALDELHEKGDKRDWVQVLANGGVATVAVLLLGITGNRAFGIAAAASFASANADTWASELGVLSRRSPRSVLTWKSLPRGTSGAVSGVGTAASAIGAGIIALWFGAAVSVTNGVYLGRFASGAAEQSNITGLAAGVVVLVAGLFGSLTDSFFGATIQAHYKTPGGDQTERPVTDGAPNRLVSGVAIVNNDAVNFISSAIAATAAGLLAGVPATVLATVL